MLDILNKKYEVKGKDFTTESLIISALMRRLRISQINLTPHELREPKGIMLTKLSSGVVAVDLQE